MSDDEFEPKLGRIGNKGGKRGARYAARVVLAARLAGSKTGVRNRRFDGSRIGRGASMGRLLSSRDRFAGLRARRAVVKTRLVRLGPKGLATARAHLRYIQRDGVTREGSPGELYARDHDIADGKSFLERCEGDRHQFRFIVSAEDGAEYPDLKPFIRRLMTQVEEDLGTRLDWVAVDHFNTGHPHTHIMLRGVDDAGKNLIIAREYVAHGFRERAAELATLDLGPRSDREIEARLRHEVRQERFTSIDRALVRSIDADRIVAAIDRDPFRQSLRAGRLRKLHDMGLAEPLANGRWRLAEDLEATLRTMAERGDIIRTMQRELTARRLARSWTVPKPLDAGRAGPEAIVGRVISRGLADEFRDRHYLLVDGVDGQAHYVDIGQAGAIGPLPEDAIVRIVAENSGIRDVDRKVAEIAAANGGRYSVDLHLRHDPSATQAFAEAHVRRLEAMRRGGARLERVPDGSWAIAPDHLDQAAAYAAKQLRERPVRVEILSSAPLARLVDVDAATLLDTQLAARDGLVIRDEGFGRDLREALAARRQWLMEQGLADEGTDGACLRTSALATLRRRELLRVATGISNELGKAFVETRSGETAAGVLRRRVDTLGGPLALVEKSREFTLVPWRDVLERRIGRQVSGIMRDDGINWRLGRERGLGIS